MMTATATIGFQNAGFTSFDSTGANTDNEIGSRSVAFPFPGRINKLRGFFAGNGATVTARCAAWRTSDGAIMAKSPQFAAPSGTASTGGQTLNTKADDGLSVVNGDAVQIGWWRLPGGTNVFSIIGSGTWEFKTDLSGDIGAFNGNTVCGGAFTCGDIEASCDITGGDAKAMNHQYPYYRKNRK